MSQIFNLKHECNKGLIDGSLKNLLKAKKRLSPVLRGSMLLIEPQVSRQDSAFKSTNELFLKEFFKL